MMVLKQATLLQRTSQTRAYANVGRSHPPVPHTARSVCSLKDLAGKQHGRWYTSKHVNEYILNALKVIVHKMRLSVSSILQF